MAPTRALHNKKAYYQVKPVRNKEGAHAPVVPNTKSRYVSTKGTARFHKSTGGQFPNGNAKEYWYG